MLPTARNSNWLSGASNPFSLFKSGLWDSMMPEFTSTIPSVNIRETKNNYQIDMAIPGMKKEDINIDVDNNVMTIWSEKETKTENEGDDEGYSRREYNYSSFSRSFTIPQNANLDKVDAKYTDGMLQLTIPKKTESEGSNGRKIKVK